MRAFRDCYAIERERAHVARRPHWSTITAEEVDAAIVGAFAAHFRQAGSSCVDCDAPCEAGEFLCPSCAADAEPATVECDGCGREVDANELDDDGDCASCRTLALETELAAEFRADE